MQFTKEILQKELTKDYDQSLIEILYNMFEANQDNLMNLSEFIKSETNLDQIILDISPKTKLYIYNNNASASFIFYDIPSRQPIYNILKSTDWDYAALDLMNINNYTAQDVQKAQIKQFEAILDGDYTFNYSVLQTLKDSLKAFLSMSKDGQEQLIKSFTEYDLDY